MSQLQVRKALELAYQHHQAGRLREAEQVYQQILVHSPNHPDVMHMLGILAAQMNRFDPAIDLIRKAIAVRANFPEAYNSLGNSFYSVGRHEEAIAAYRQAVALKPYYAEALSNLGGSLREVGRLDESIAACRQAVAVPPNFVVAHFNLGVALKDRGLLDDAIAAYRKALALNPRDPVLLCNLGVALKDKGLLDEAIAVNRQALALQPAYPEGLSNLGNALGAKGLIEDAIAAFRQAVALKPDFAEAHYNLGLKLLLRGELPEGWKEYAWRWKVRALGEPTINMPQPLWDGSPLQGRTILVYVEQGAGDFMQFTRYLPLLAQQGGKVLVACPREVYRLIRSLPAVEAFVPSGPTLPAFDVRTPLLNLPNLMGTTLANIPNTVPYLQPEPADVEHWKPRLAAHAGKLKVGIVWAGNPAHKNDSNRSMRLSDFVPLAAVPGVQLFSLQKGAALAEVQNPPNGMSLIDVSPELGDFADTAALVANLDLVISVDTSVAHLAGALAKPVWTLLPFVPDWRWMLGRDDTPWYPTMRLFRQPAIGDWQSVMTRVAAELARLAQPAA